MNKLLKKFKDKKLNKITHLLKRRNGEVFTITIQRGDKLNEI